MRQLRDEEIKKLHRIAAHKDVARLRTAIYARKSTEDATDTSIASQINKCREFIQSNDSLLLLEDTHIYQEENVSGYYVEKRNQLTLLLDQVKQGRIDVVVTLKFDRFSRNIANTQQLLETLQRNNAYLIAGDDQGDNSAAGILIKQVMFALNEFQVRNTAENVMRVHTKLVEDGKTVGGPGNYGYKIVDRKYLQNKDEAPAVQMVFDMFLEGNSYSQIADELEVQGYKPRKSKRFSNASLHDILTNSRNCGFSVWNAKDKRRTDNRIIQQEFDEVVSEDVVLEPIISVDKYERVQEILSGRTKSRSLRQGTAYLLTGFIKCSCGNNLIGNSHKKSNRKNVYRAYECSNHSKRNGHICPTKGIKTEYLDTVVKKYIVSIINKHYSTNPITKATVKEYLKDEKSRVKRLKREITLEEQTLSDLVKGYHKEHDDVLKKLTEKEIKEHNTLIESSKEKLNSLNRKLRQVENRMKKINTGQLRMNYIFNNNLISRRIVEIFIDEIYVDNDEIQITFKGDEK